MKSENKLPSSFIPRSSIFDEFVAATPYQASNIGNKTVEGSLISSSSIGFVASIPFASAFLVLT